MTMLKQESRPMSSSTYTRNNDLRLRNNPNSRSRSSVDTPPSSPNQSGSRSRSRSSRSCCFSCCGLTVRSNPDPPRSSRGGNGTKLEPKAAPQDLELQPTAEDVRLWGESFDNVMATACGRKWFRDFLRCEYSEENILFWLACEDLKKETNPEIVEEKARIIYEDYISILSPKEVSLDSRVREMVNRNMVEPSRHTFDEAQLQIFTLMHRDSYPRFVNSQQYRNLVDKYLKNTAKLQSTNNSAGASTQQQQTQSSSSSNSQQRAGSTG